MNEILLDYRFAECIGVLFIPFHSCRVSEIHILKFRLYPSRAHQKTSIRCRRVKGS